MSNIEVVSPGTTPNGLFGSECEAIVNAVNVVGVMGAGLALAFKNNFPRMYKEYEQACKNHELKLGTLHTYKNPETALKKGEYKWIVNFPTMHYPGEVTLKKNLESGFKALTEFVRKNDVKSIAIPALGCGIGSFSWEELLPMIEAWAAENPGVHVKAYEPQPQVGWGAKRS